MLLNLLPNLNTSISIQVTKEQKNDIIASINFKCQCLRQKFINSYCACFNLSLNLFLPQFVLVSYATNC